MSNVKVFKEGIRDGIPIGLGYFAVAFSLGIAARNAGLTAFQATLSSLLCNASAGQYAGYTLIDSGGSYLGMVIVTAIANARYLLMSFALSQRLDPKTSIFHRLLIGFTTITDELFGIAIARKGYINPIYSYGAYIIASPSWALGTFLGVIAGNMLPIRAVSALSVALYGMFLAIIIPPCKTNKIIRMVIFVCFVVSLAAHYLPFLSTMNSGTRIIVLTIILSLFFAVIFPKEVGNEDE